MNRALVILSPLLVLASYWLALVSAGDGQRWSEARGLAVRRELSLLAMPRPIPLPPRRRMPRPPSEARCTNALESASKVEPARLDVFGATALFSELRGCRRHPELITRLRAVELSCRRFVDDELSPECRQAFFHLRSAAIAYGGGESDPEKVADADVLAHRLYLLESFSEKDGEWQWREKMSVSERLLELQPDNTTAAEFLLTGIAGLVQDEPRLGDNEELWRKAERAVRVLDPQSEERVEWEVFLGSEGMKANLVEEAAREAINEHPESGMGYYWLAYASARSRDSEGTEEALAEAYRLDPGNRRVRAAWDEMRLSRAPIFTLGEMPSAKTLLSY